MNVLFYCKAVLVIAVGYCHSLRLPKFFRVPKFGSLFPFSALAEVIRCSPTYFLSLQFRVMEYDPNQDEAVSNGPGSVNGLNGVRPLSPSASASHSSPSIQADTHMPVAENWCHTQVNQLKLSRNYYLPPRCLHFEVKILSHGCKQFCPFRFGSFVKILCFSTQPPPSLLFFMAVARERSLVPLCPFSNSFILQTRHCCFIIFRSKL